jgi:hypothetical protein
MLLAAPLPLTCRIFLCGRYRDAHPEPEDEALASDKGSLSIVIEKMMANPLHTAATIGAVGGALGVYSVFLPSSRIPNSMRSLSRMNASILRPLCAAFPVQ